MVIFHSYVSHYQRVYLRVSDFPKILMAGGHVSEPGQGKVIALDEMGP